MNRRVGAVEKVIELHVYAKNWTEVFHQGT